MRLTTALACLAPLLFWQCARSDLAQIENVRVAGPLQESTVPIEFDLQWSHSFRNAVNWDAAWVFVKFRLGVEPWRHATLSSPEKHVSIRDDNGVAAKVVVTPDGMGAFVFRTAPGTGPVDWDGVGVSWNYAADGVPDGAQVSVHIIAIEVVHVPTGPFVLGDAEGGNVRGHFRRATDAMPFAVTGEGAMTLGGSTPGGLDSNDSYGMAEPFIDDFNESVSVELPARFPKGYAGFYIMKYELTEGLYAAFLNTLDQRQQQARSPAQGTPDARPGLGRYTITSTAPFIAAVPDRAAHLLSWPDGAAFADWAALRPMTEFEFEKAARGPATPTPGEFAWGTDDIHQRRYSLVYRDTPSERVRDAGYETGNAAYDLTTGGSGHCWSCLGGPLRVGAFAAAGATRKESGASYYGVLDLSGNLVERVVTVANSAGRRFDGRHGNGSIGANGNANGLDVARWPGTTATGAQSQIAGALGGGLRGGGWTTPAANLRISDREYAATTDNKRDPAFGYRFVRTAPAQPDPGAGAD